MEDELDFSLEEWKGDDSFLQDIDIDSYLDESMPEWSLEDLAFQDDSYWGDFWKNIGKGASGALSGVNKFLGSDTAKNLLTLGSGIYGMFESDKLRGMAEEAFRRGDPFGDYRKGYADKLQTLMDNPESLTELPGYKFQFEQGAEALSRKMASKGYLGSGNMGTALVQYGQDFASNFRDREMDRLAMLAGANISPNQSAGLAGYGSGIDVASQSLASLGYGVEDFYNRGRVETPRPVKGPNSAGGEAAQVGAGLNLLGTGLSMFGSTRSVGKAVGGAGKVISGISSGGTSGARGAVKGLQDLSSFQYDPSGIGYAKPSVSKVGSGPTLEGSLNTAGDLLGIYSGIEQGGAAGYAKAAGSVANMAGYNVPALGYVDALSKLAEGDVGGGGYSAAVVAAGPVAAIGSFAADTINKSLVGHGDEKRNDAAFKANFPGITELPLYRQGTYRILPDGRVLDEKSYRALSGSFYGAAYAPDGNKDYWTSEYKRLNESLQSTDRIKDWSWFLKNNKLLQGYTWDSANRRLVKGG